MGEGRTGGAERATSSDKLVVGRISGLFGVRGWVKIFSYTDPRTAILELGPWYVGVEGQWRRHPLAEGKRHSKGVIARLEGVEGRDTAARLLGAEIAIERDQLPEAGPTEFYWADLVGLSVETLEGVPLGRVDHLIETGANDVLVVHAEDGRERLLPFVREEVIREVDLQTGVIRVDWDPEF